MRRFVARRRLLATSIMHDTASTAAAAIAMPVSADIPPSGFFCRSPLCLSSWDGGDGESRADNGADCGEVNGGGGAWIERGV